MSWPKAAGARAKMEATSIAIGKLRRHGLSGRECVLPDKGMGGCYGAEGRPTMYGG